MGQVWDDELKANVYREYGTDTTLKEAHAGFPSLRPQDTDPGDELDKLARQRMTMFPAETYRQALNQVLADNPELRAAYASIK
jgi:hypothetical protein